jgi:hypothetical protein
MISRPRVMILESQEMQTTGFRTVMTDAGIALTDGGRQSVSRAFAVAISWTGSE